RLRGGKEIHGYIYMHCLLDDTTTLTALVLMYLKCGKLDFSRKVFEMMSRKYNVAWNTMIIAYLMHTNESDGKIGNVNEESVNQVQITNDDKKRFNLKEVGAVVFGGGFESERCGETDRVVG
nr:pentatricopeptide repeat-containing protein At1g20230-like [Tanacetum cinerariifolium]